MVICSYSMLKVEGSNPRDCALRPLTAGIVSGWIYLFAVGSGRLYVSRLLWRANMKAIVVGSMQPKAAGSGERI